MRERPRDGRLLAGVCLGVAQQLTIDVTLTRLAFVLLTFAWGIGALLYFALWLLLPDADSAGHTGSLREAARDNLWGMRQDLRHTGRRLSAAWSRRDAGPWPRPLDRRWIALTLVGGGALILLLSLGAFDWLNAPRAIGLAVVAIGAGLLVSMR